LIKKYNTISLVIGVPGFLVQLFAGGLVAVAAGLPPDGAAAILLLVGMAIGLIGTALLIGGLAYYAKAKGRSPAWGLMGFLGLIGLIVLGSLADYESPRSATDPAANPSDNIANRFIEVQPRTGTLHRASLILGVLSLVGCVLPIINLLLAVPAIVCGHMALARSRQDPSADSPGSPGTAKAGLVFGYIGLTISVIFGILLLRAIWMSQ
jgi:hypothetical protein